MGYADFVTYGFDVGVDDGNAFNPVGVTEGFNRIEIGVKLGGSDGTTDGLTCDNRDEFADGAAVMPTNGFSNGDKLGRLGSTCNGTFDGTKLVKGLVLW